MWDEPHTPFPNQWVKAHDTGLHHTRPTQGNTNTAFTLTLQAQQTPKPSHHFETPMNTKFSSTIKACFTLRTGLVILIASCSFSVLFLSAWLFTSLFIRFWNVWNQNLFSDTLVLMFGRRQVPCKCWETREAHHWSLHAGGTAVTPQAWGPLSEHHHHLCHITS